jgi:multiple sugar transport system substrate-binding protein
MKRLTTLFISALLVALMAGFGAAQDFEMVDPSGTTITFWHQHSRDREAALMAIVDQFNTSNEYGITVTAEFQGGYGDIFQKMLPVLGSSDTPNLVVAYQNQAATYQLAEGIIDLRALVDSEMWGLSADEQSDFFAGFYNADIFPSFDNARLGFPPNRSMEMMYYNTEWLAELSAAGAISFEGPPSNPEQFREAACAATANPFSMATSEGSIGYELSLDASRFASWTFAFGGDVFDYDAGRYTYDSAGAVEAMTFLQGLFDDGCALMVSERFGDQTNFGAGRTMFTVGSSSGLPFYRSAVEAGANHQWSVAAIPHTTADPVMNIYGASVSIPVGHSPEETVAAWLFLKYYTSPDIQAQWAEASNYFPVRESVAAGLGDYFDANPAYQTAFDLLQYGVTEPPAPGYDFVRDFIEGEMAAIMDGAEVDSTLTDANDEANVILADQLADMQ